MRSAGTADPHAAAIRLGRSSAYVFYAVLAVYVAAMLALSGRFQYSLYADSTSYLSIAQAYARGQFWDAVNGYWSPLYCWSLALLLAAGVDLLLAPKLLSLALGVLTLAGLRRLCRRIGLGEAGTAIVLVALLLPLVSFSLIYVSPDFLLVAVLTWYLAEVAGWTPSSGARAGVRAGALGGMAYLSKQYALPFVTAHLALAAALHYYQHQSSGARTTVRRWVLVAYLVLFAVAGPWIVVMSAKYDRLTIAAAGTYNWYLLSTGFNVGTRSLAPPPFPGAASAWVDPTPYAHAAPSLTREAVEPPLRGLTAGLMRVQRLVVMLEQFSFLALIILAAAAVLAVGDARRSGDYRYAQVGLALAVYIGGYQIVTAWFVDRLMWIVPILLALLGGLVYERLAALFRVRQGLRVVAAGLLVVSFWPLPLLRLIEELDEGRELHTTALILERHDVRGRFASLNRYADSLRVAFLTGSSYYGRIAPPATVDRVLSELGSYEIDFLLIWDEGDSRDFGVLQRELTERFPDATPGEIKGRLTALSVRQNTPQRPVRSQPPDD